MKRLLSIVGFAVLISMPTDSFSQKIGKKKEEANQGVQMNQSLELKKPIKFAVPYDKVPKISPEFAKRIKLTPLDSKTIDKTDKATLSVGSSSGQNEMVENNKTQMGQDGNCYTVKKTVNVKTSEFSWFTAGGGAPAYANPGVVMNYQSILSGSNKIIGDERFPMDIYLSNPIAGSKLSPKMVTVEKPHLTGHIINGMGMLIEGINEDIPANMSFTITEVNSEKELQYAMNGSYDYSGGMSSVSAKFGISGNDFSKKHYYFVEFIQHLYTIVADPNTVEFKNTPNKAQDLVFISEVNYGRRGVMLVETSKSSSEFKSSASIGGGYGFHSGNIDAFLKTVKSDSDSSIKLFFYGGKSGEAASSLTDDDVKNGFNKWLIANAGSGQYALPISYRLKNLKGEDLTLKSSFEQVDRDCVVAKKLKLKVTLLGIENWRTRTGNATDYGIQMGTKYSSNGTVLPATSIQRNRFPHRTNCSNYPLSGAVSLVCGDKQDKINVSVNPTTKRKFTNNINNYVIYEIPPNMVTDKQAKFEVGFWVKNYSTKGDLMMNTDFQLPRTVDIYSVLGILQGADTGHKFSSKKLSDESLDVTGAAGGFELFDQVHAPMMKVTSGSQTYLDAIFRARNESNDNLEKAWIFLRFELID